MITNAVEKTLCALIILGFILVFPAFFICMFIIGIGLAIKEKVGNRK